MSYTPSNDPNERRNPPLNNPPLNNLLDGLPTPDTSAPFNRAANTPNPTPAQGRWIMPVIIAVIVIGAGLLLLPRLFGGADDSTIPAGDRAVSTNAMQPEPIRIETLTAASELDSDGCAATEAANFTRRQTVYVVGQAEEIPASTSVFARLYFNGTAIEDTAPIVSDQTYRDTCINFAFEPINEGFEAGAYEAEFFVNGNPAGMVSFTVR